MLPKRNEITMVNQDIELHTIPCLADNYAFVVYNKAQRSALVVDVPDATPILEMLKTFDITSCDIFITHHHGDHIDGLSDLQSGLTAFKSCPKTQVIGALNDKYRLPDLDLAVTAGQTVKLAGFTGQIYDVSGHTIGHLALHIEAINAVFTADSLMAMGCGRLFEGSPQQMWDSLLQLRNLPANTLVYSGHEYTSDNMAFALSLNEDNRAITARASRIAKDLSEGRSTVPSLLSDELQTNPFLRADDQALQSAIGMLGAPAAKVFATIRAKKDNF
ncbi:MAG: hydroxyacylglutathione hydrolase [Planktomarina sp.]|nr:hydroxyacylglutathione hydrolase [Planktomarina sp.]